MHQGRRSIILAAASVFAVALAWHPAAAQEKPPIKIAHTAPMSGIQASVGKLQAIAVDLAIADVNAKGGVNGSKLELTRYDDGLKPDEGVLRIRDAIAANNVAIIGPLSGTQWETAAPLLNQLKFPGFNLNASKGGINKRPWALRLAIPDDTGLPEGLADFTRQFPAMKTVVVMGDVREASGKAAVDLWTTLAGKANLKVLDQVTFTSGQSDFSSIAIRVKELNPDGILLSMLAPDAVRLAHEMQIQGLKAPILGNGLIWPGTLPQTLSKTIGEDARLWHATGSMTNDYAPGDPALYKSFVERYSAEVMKDSGMSQFTPPNVANSAAGYDVVLLIADILRRKGIDGNTPVVEARQKMMEGMVETKEIHGNGDYKITEAGDGYMLTYSLEIDPERHEWVLRK
jgi:branched-chain amino acid transport system substrate-binding protein